MICGAIWGGALPNAPLTGVGDVLSPFGSSATAACSIGGWRAEVKAFDDSAQSLARSPAGALVCADVFLHDRQALCHRLGTAEHLLDVELVALAYDRWGRDLCRHLSGSFAIAVFDERRGGVFLARDHSGAKFLALHQRDDAVAFASTSLALTGFPGVDHTLDAQRLSELAIAGYGTTRTFVRGVQSLAPGSWFWMDPANRRIQRWWEPERLEVIDEGSLEAHAAALRTEFERSVGAVLRGVASPGVLLSGGLDSGSIAAVAGRQLAPRLLRSYTSVPPRNWTGRVPRGWVADERDAVNAIGRATTNLRPRFVDLEGRPLFDHQRDLWELGGGPDRNPLNAVWEHECVKEAAADGVDVLLLGASGNHGFSADGPFWLAQLARRGRLRDVVREARAWKSTTGQSVTRSLRGLVMWPLLPSPVRDWHSDRKGAGAVSEWLSATAIRPEQLESLDLDEVLAEITRPHTAGWTRDLSQLYLARGAQAETDAAYVQRFGVELRDPTADRRLNELAVQQPEWWRRRNGVTRAICRSAMTDVLPAEVVERRTLGAQLPDWLDRMTAEREWFAEQLEEMRDHPASREVFDVERLRGIHAAWPDRAKMDDVSTVYQFRFALLRSVMLSRYARWFEERGRRVAAGGPAVVLRDPV